MRLGCGTRPLATEMCSKENWDAWYSRPPDSGAHLIWQASERKGVGGRDCRRGLGGRECTRGADINIVGEVGGGGVRGGGGGGGVRGVRGGRPVFPNRLAAHILFGK